MKTFVAATVVALASVATAQLDAVPSCALNCFLDPLSSDGCESLEDFACHCEQSDSLFASVTPCVQDACSPEEQETVISAVEETCASAGVPVEVPTPGASSVMSTAMEETPETTVEPDTTVVATSAVMTDTVIASTPVYTDTVIASPSSEHETPSPTMSMGNGTMTAGPSPSEFTGAAAQATQGAAILGAAALAMFAL